MIKKTMAVWLTQPEEYVKNGYNQAHITEDTTDMTGEGWLRVASVVVEFELPSRESLVPATLTAIDAQMTKLDAAYAMKRIELQRNRNELLAITMESL